MRIAVLFHAGDRQSNLASYIVHHLAQYWREDGHEVVYLFGTWVFAPADLLLVHVNLSVVPGEYLKFAARYPIALNARVGDIRKSAISRNLVRPGAAWEGPVIVKSNLNYGGQPEETLGGNWLEQRFPMWRSIVRRSAKVLGWYRPMAHWQSYQVFASMREVPRSWLRSRQLVVEKFRPEREGGLYHLRIYQFLGDRYSCSRLASSGPVVKAQNSLRIERVEPHPEILAWRKRLGIDYGKLDYVVDDGEVVLLDVNKTTGASRHMADADLPAMRRYLAEGLYSYFNRAPAPGSRAARGDGDVLDR
jgi:hypothetical protein